MIHIRENDYCCYYHRGERSDKIPIQNFVESIMIEILSSRLLSNKYFIGTYV